MNHSEWFVNRFDWFIEKNWLIKTTHTWIKCQYMSLLPVQVEGCDFSIVPLEVREIIQIHIGLLMTFLSSVEWEWSWITLTYCIWAASLFLYNVLWVVQQTPLHCIALPLFFIAFSSVWLLHMTQHSKNALLRLKVVNLLKNASLYLAFFIPLAFFHFTALSVMLLNASSHKTHFFCL